MPRSSNGDFSLPVGTIVATGDTLLPAQHNPAMSDIAAALTGSLSRTGRGGMQADLDMNGYRVVGAAAGSLAVGLFSAINTLKLSGVDLIQTSGHTWKGIGAALYVADPAVDAAYVASFPRTSKISADGVGFRLYLNQELHIEMAGGRADCPHTPGVYTPDDFTKTWYAPPGVTDNWPAVNEMMRLTKTPTFISNAAGSMQPIHFKGAADNNLAYYFSNTIVPPFAVCLKGTHSGLNISNTGTVFRFPANMRGIKVNLRHHQPGYNGTGNSAFDAAGTIIEGIYLQGGGGTDRTAHGVMHTAQIVWRNCVTDSFAGNARHNVATLGLPSSDERFGVTSGSIYEAITSRLSGNWGGFTDGDDVSASTFIQLEDFSSRLGGQYDGGAFCNTYIGYYNQGHADGHRGACNYAGRNYALVSPIAGIGSTTTPGTNPEVWEYVKDQAAPSAPWPAWSSGATYELSLPIYSSGRSDFFGGYNENYYLPCVTKLGAIWNSQMQVSRRTPQFGALAFTPGPAMASNIPLLVRQQYAPGEMPLLGLERLVQLGGSGSGNDAAILSFGRQSEASPALYRWAYDGPDQRFGLGLPGGGFPPIFAITGRDTTKDFGTGVPQKGAFVPQMLVVTDPGNANAARILQTSESAPIGSAVARGQRFMNANPTAGGRADWVATVAGIAGSTAVINPANPINA